jgi:hypothetical protein
MVMEFHIPIAGSRSCIAVGCHSHKEKGSTITTIHLSNFRMAIKKAITRIQPIHGSWRGCKQGTTTHQPLEAMLSQRPLWQCGSE